MKNKHDVRLNNEVPDCVCWIGSFWHWSAADWFQLYGDPVQSEGIWTAIYFLLCCFCILCFNWPVFPFTLDKQLTWSPDFCGHTKTGKEPFSCWIVLKSGTVCMKGCESYTVGPIWMWTPSSSLKATFIFIFCVFSGSCYPVTAAVWIPFAFTEG